MVIIHFMILARMTATLHKPIVKIILTSWSKLNFISSVVLYEIHPCNFLKLVANALPNSCYVALEKGISFINSYEFFLTFFSYILIKRWSDLWHSSLARINNYSLKQSFKWLRFCFTLLACNWCSTICNNFAWHIFIDLKMAFDTVDNSILWN